MDLGLLHDVKLLAWVQRLDLLASFNMSRPEQSISAWIEENKCAGR